MFYYVIFNSTVLNYSSTNNKNLNTFIYGTVLYILLHGLINSYNNQFAQYIKSYFWVILSIDIFAIYYMHNYINQELENDTNSLKSLLDSFYNKKNTDDSQQTKNKNKDIQKNKNKENNEEKNNEETNNIDNDNDEEEDNIEDSNQNQNQNQKNKEPIPFQLDDFMSNETIDQDQMSDAGSDIDLDKFEMSL